MIVASNNENVRAVIAFSPGELFCQYSVKAIEGFQQNLFITARIKNKVLSGN